MQRFQHNIVLVLCYKLFTDIKCNIIRQLYYSVIHNNGLYYLTRLNLTV